MEIERRVNPVSLLNVPLGGLALWDNEGTPCLGIRVAIPGSQDLCMVELSPLDDTNGASPVIRRLGYPETSAAVLFGDEYFVDYKLADAVQITMGEIEFSPWRIIVSGDKAHLLVGAGGGRACIDLASGMFESLPMGPKYGLDRWRIVRTEPNGERETVFERGG